MKYLALGFALFSAVAGAQSNYPRNSVRLAANVGIVRSNNPADGDASGRGVDVGYSYRFTRFTALETGYAGSKFKYCPYRSQDCIHYADRAHFVSYGGQLILPLFKGRVQIFGGVGGAIVHLPDELSAAGTRSVLQYSWGFNIAFDRARRWRVGAIGRSFRNAASAGLRCESESWGVSYSF